MTTARTPMRGDVRRSIVNALEYSYGPVFVTLGYCYFFAFSDAAQEVLLGFLTDLDLGLFYTSNPDAGWSARLSKPISLLLLAGLPIIAYATAKGTVDAAASAHASDGDTHPRPEPYAWVIYLTLCLACALAFPTGFIRAYASLEADHIGYWPIGYLALFNLPILGMVIYVVRTEKAMPEFWWVTWINATLSQTHALTHRLLPPLGKAFDWIAAHFDNIQVWIAVAAWLSTIILSVWFLLDPSIATLIGPVGTTATFVIFACFFLYYLTARSLKMPGHTPLILILFGFTMASTSTSAAIAFFVILAISLVTVWRWKGERPPLFFTFTLLAAVYVVGHLYGGRCETLSGCNIVPGVEKETAQPKNLAAAWDLFEAAQDKDAASETPVRIIAAQGGGLYAAYHTAYYLAARADADPGFARSVFAVSGVSGGSVGAAIYWAVRASGNCDSGGHCHRAAVRSILERDYLSTALSGLLFRDNLDGVIPYSAILPQPMDRGRAMENEFIQHTHRWQHGGKSDAPALLASAMSGSFRPQNGAPLLYFNGTRVDDGRRYVFSPVASWGHPLGDGGTPTDANDPDHYSAFTLDSGRDLRVATAMMISARFPAVSPPARLTQTDAEGRLVTLQMVDGGYFDNSGIETAHDIIRDLRNAGVTRKIELVALKVNETPGEDAWKPEMKGFLGAPLSGFFAAWRARIPLSDRRFAEATVGQTPPLANVVTRTAPISADAVNFTLSWYLACGTFRDIAAQVDAQVGQINTASCKP